MSRSRVRSRRPGSQHAVPQLRTEQPTVGNLPQRLVSLVGRDGDVAAVLGRLDGRDVVTIVGVGGIGKTDLALSCAAERRLGFEHGVWVCELASVGEPDAVASAIGQVIGARQHPGRSMVDSVAEYCRASDAVDARPLEHVLDAVGDLVEALLDVAPGVAVLATSREALGVDGEQMSPLASLSSVGADAPASSCSSSALTLWRRVSSGVLAMSKRSSGSVSGSTASLWRSSWRQRVCVRLALPRSNSTLIGRSGCCVAAVVASNDTEPSMPLSTGPTRPSPRLTGCCSIDWQCSPVGSTWPRRRRCALMATWSTAMTS